MPRQYFVASRRNGSWSVGFYDGFPDSIWKVSRDRSTVSFVGTVASPQQIHNANLTNFLYQAWARLVKLSEEHTPFVFGILQPSTQVGTPCYKFLMPSFYL